MKRCPASLCAPLTTKWYTATLFLAVLAATGLACASTGPAPTSPGSVRDTVVEVIDALEAGCLLPANDPCTRRNLIRALLNTLDRNITLIPAEEATACPSPTAQSTVTSSATLGGLFAYLRLAEVTAGTVTELTRHLADARQGHYEGIVVDLRYTVGGDAAAAGQAAEILGQPGLPMALLVNGETIGAAEKLASMAKQTCGAMIVGQPTRGLPFSRESVRLKTGDVLLFPRVTPGSATCGNWHPTPLQPDVRVDQTLSKEALDNAVAGSDVAATVDRDACLRRAVDLLTAIVALENKHF